jgi:hypothetical protein
VGIQLSLADEKAAYLLPRLANPLTIVLRVILLIYSNGSMPNGLAGLPLLREAILLLFNLISKVAFGILNLHFHRLVDFRRFYDELSR